MSLCESIPVIPQNIGTCWFNAILMTMIYSDGLSYLVAKKAVEDNWQDDENGAFKTLMLLFLNYVRAIKKGNSKLIEKLKKFLDKYKAEIILLDYLSHYHKELFSIYELITDKGLYAKYLNEVLKRMGLNALLITSSNYINYEEVKFDYVSTTYKNYEDNDRRSIDNPDILLCEITFEELNELGYPEIPSNKINKFGKEMMTFNGIRYKLDCILLYDKDNTHIIAGLNCNNVRYVYNGWWSGENKPCNLMPMDWSSNIGDFCLDTKNCRLPKYKNESDLCFDFKINERLMVYVKIDEEIVIEKRQVRRINAIRSLISSQKLLSSVHSKDKEEDYRTLLILLINFMKFKNDEIYEFIDKIELDDEMIENLNKLLDTDVIKDKETLKSFLKNKSVKRMKI